MIIAISSMATSRKKHTLTVVHLLLRVDGIRKKISINIWNDPSNITKSVNVREMLI